MFIAIESAEKHNSSHEPLPNLEARIVCADTLDTIADPDWRPDRPATLGDTDPDFAIALSELAKNRKRWYDAHSESEKAELRYVDETLREKLESYLDEKGNETITSPELIGFVEFPLLGSSAERGRTDVRLLFYEPDRDGFDIVIGNPPYERLSNSIDNHRKRALQNDKGYKTTRADDLYPLFCEVALALAKPNSGVVTMIVPFSIAFARGKQALRELFERRSALIAMRHYDIRPATIFKESFSVRVPQNSQWATIITAKLQAAGPSSIYTTGLQRWSAPDRGVCLKQRANVKISCHNASSIGQWPRIPTKEVAGLFNSIMGQNQTVLDMESQDGVALSIPETARYYVSITPEKIARTIRHSLLTVADTDDLTLLTAALNGHVAYAWWRIFGDGFHVKKSDFKYFAIPDEWAANPGPARELGRRLLDAIPDCPTSEARNGVYENYNLHLKPDLIEELDRFHIVALGLAVEPLLTQLKVMRSNKSWDFGGTD